MFGRSYRYDFLNKVEEEVEDRLKDAESLCRDAEKRNDPTLRDEAKQKLAEELASIGDDLIKGNI